MKKKIKTIVYAILVVAAAFAYSHIAKTHNIYDKEIDTSQYENTGLLTDLGVCQKFVSPEEYLDGVRIKTTVLKTAENTKISYSLKDTETGEIKAAGNTEGKLVKNSKFFELPFERVEDCKGRAFELFVSANQKAGDTEGIGFAYEPQTEENTSLTIAGQKSENGTLVLKTVTHRFDFETFFVLLAFVLYVVLFMRFLYNLFK